jgi:hypothetical protein
MLANQANAIASTIPDKGIHQLASGLDLLQSREESERYLPDLADELSEKYPASFELECIAVNLRDIIENGDSLEFIEALRTNGMPEVPLPWQVLEERIWPSVMVCHAN